MTEQPQSLDDWLGYIESVHPVGWDLGLDRVADVGTKMGLLHPGQQVVLVAGTNGKGSTCEVLSKLLGAQGLKVGKSTSPHLFRFNERIQINDLPVSDSIIIDALEAIDHVRGDVTLTYFEFATLASLYIFEQADVDVAVLEIGLGGRLDAMNIVDPDLCIITSIALDHQNYLGDTREVIGKEKAGIMRTDVPCIIADPKPPHSLSEVALKKGTPISQIGRDFQIEPALDRGLPAESVAAAMYAFEVLGYPITDALKAMIPRITLAGRMQNLVWKGRKIILDVAHNPEAAERLFDRIDWSAVSGRTYGVIGLYRDKDIEGVCEPFRDVLDQWFTVAAEEDRALPSHELKLQIDRLYPTGESGKVRSCDKMAVAADSVEKMSEPEDLVLVFGSFPIVAQALDFFK